MDVCRAIGYSIKADGSVNASLAVKKLQPHETITCRISGSRFGRPSILISESGLYKLIMRGDSAQAVVFQDWVARDVLPAIRKDGAYIMGEEKVKTGEMSEDELIAKGIA